MAKIIEELKEEHRRLLEMLKNLKSLDLRSKELEEGLGKVKEVLISHLNKEDNRLYPALRTAAERDRDLKETLQLFAKDMEKISQFISSFFDKYSSGIHSVDFAVDFGKFLTTLEGRIKKEEAILFPAYERLQ